MSTRWLVLVIAGVVAVVLAIAIVAGSGDERPRHTRLARRRVAPQPFADGS